MSEDVTTGRCVRCSGKNLRVIQIHGWGMVCRTCLGTAFGGRGVTHLPPAPTDDWPQHVRRAFGAVLWSVPANAEFRLLKSERNRCLLVTCSSASFPEALFRDVGFKPSGGGWELRWKVQEVTDAP